jgi:hypothetical protein
MASLEHVLKAGECEDRAATLRLLARKTRYPDIRDELLRLAQGFERLAKRIEARESIAAEGFCCKSCRGLAG